MPMRPWLLLPFTWTCATAHAADVVLAWQGRLSSPAGAPLQGPTALTIGLHGAATGGVAFFTDTFDVLAEDGFVSANLGSNAPLDGAELVGRDVWIEVAVGGVTLGPRAPLVSVPRAVSADVASAIRVEGAATGACAEPGALRWDTAAKTLRVCVSGAWTSVLPDPASCDPGDALRVNQAGDAWECGPVGVAVNRTFTPCSATGRNGPSQTQCDAAYGVNVVAVTAGYQRFTIPETGVYHLVAAGAQGGRVGTGTGGRGAVAQADFSLLGGDQLVVVVGQRGADKACSDWGASGGGGTYIARVVSSGGESLAPLGLQVQPLLVAGGGAGTTDDQAGCAFAAEGGRGFEGSGGGGTGGEAGGGGGWRSNGSGSTGSGGLGFLQGATGGTRNSSFPIGGFGGGGGPYDGGGSGGGWSGGSVANNIATAGSSYSAGTGSTVAPASNTGDGYATITN